MNSKKIDGLNYITLLNDLGAFIVSPILGIYLVKYLGFSVTKVGIASSAVFVANILGSYVGGYYLKKIGEKNLLYISLLLQVLAFSLFPVSTNFIVLCALNGVFGLGYSMSNLTIQSIIIEYTKEEELKGVFAKRGVMSNIGISVGVLIAGSLVNGNRIKLSFIVSVVLIALALIMGIILFNKVQFTVLGSKKESRTSLGVVFKNRQYLTFNIVILGFWASYSVFMLNTPLFIVSKFPKFNIGLVYFINTLVIVTLQIYLIRVFSKKYLNSKIVFIGILTLASAFLIFWFSGVSNSIVILLIGIVAFSIAEILTIPLIPTYISSICPKTDCGIYLAGMMIFKYVGFSMGNILGGILTDIVQSIGMNMYTIWVVYFLVTMVTAITFFVLVVKHDKNTLDEI